jgi:hypothetical protein
MSDNDGTQDFRDSATFLDDLDDGDLALEPERSKRSPKSKRKAQVKERGLFGLQPGQAFIIAAMLFFLVCLVGSAILIVMDKMALPF